MSSLDYILKISDLSTYFYTSEGIVKAVDSVSLAIPRGHCFGLIGESGCGKTVTAYSILRLVPDPPGKITAGKIFFKGQNLLDVSNKSMRKIRGKDISMIFQEPSSSMNPSFTIGNQIEEVIRFHQGGKASDIKRKAYDIINAVQIPDPNRILKQYPHELSGGMLQRVMIAMAISCEPDLLICDEPTTALDVSMQAQIIQLINQLRKEKGTSVLFITHDLGVLSWVCTYAAVMYAGKIVEHANIRNLINNPRHPYTRALIGASPRIDKDVEMLASIEGTVPGLINPPSGCRFHPRCSLKIPICSSNKSPELKKIRDEHWVACFTENIGEMA